MLDFIILLVIVALTFLGFKKGFLSSIINLVSYFLSLFLAWTMYTPVSNFLMKTPLMDFLESFISKNYIAPSDPNITAQTLGLPKIFDGFIRNSVSSPLNAAGDAISIAFASLILNIISAILVFVLAKCVILLLLKGLNIITKLPIIKQFDKVGGIVFGFIQGLLFVYIMLAAFTVIAPIQNNIPLQKAIDESSLAKSAYYNNPILNMFVKEN